jgi:hypothetical protein
MEGRYGCGYGCGYGCEYGCVMHVAAAQGMGTACYSPVSGLVDWMGRTRVVWTTVFVLSYDIDFLVRGF